ncbi:MAG TPA: flagellar hook-associated protein FlgK [Bdellovibrionales bacterium]|nr:flagellar hook-associated protein FlgK [Bdellovibrionales bacterium]
MSKIHGMMDVGKRSMMNSQTALQTVGHNIANKGTEGYSRQRVELQTAEPIGIGKLRIGMGSKTAAVTRVNNPYLEKQIGNEQATLGYWNSKHESMTRVEAIYNEQLNKGLNTFVSDFFNTFRELSNNPESLATRTQVKESADLLTKDFKRINNQLTEIQKDIDHQVEVQVFDINEMTTEIAKLNEKIQMVEIQGSPANDERDRRDLLIKNLGERINIRWAEGEDGMVTITGGNSALLVAGTDAKQLSVQATPETDTKGEANFDVFYKSSNSATPIKVTQQFSGGALGGLLEVRDQHIGNLLKDVDQMAYGLATTVNAVHSRGFDGYNKQGQQFFAVPDSVRHAARAMAVSDAISKDPVKIAAAASPSGPGDNRIATALSRLQFENIMGNADRTPANLEEAGAANTVDEFYNAMVGKVGIQTRKAETSAASQKDIVGQLKNIRESISGVSLDEETTKMIEFQKAYDASARLIRTADEMFDTVLNLKRM